MEILSSFELRQAVVSVVQSLCVGTSWPRPLLDCTLAPWRHHEFLVVAKSLDECGALIQGRGSLEKFEAGGGPMLS